ncbi:MAG TPA: TonB-dependent receptor, partial [Wenzhouxiangella sp.]
MTKTNKMPLGILTWCGLFWLISLGLWGIASGQSSSDPVTPGTDPAVDSPAPSPQTESTDMDTIVVTASRSLAPMSQWPQSVSVVKAEDFQEPNLGLGLDEWLNRVPGVFFQNRYNFAQNIRISTRGFGARAPFGVRGIQLLSDGFPETLPDGQAQVDSVDLQSLVGAEVIRGPSSVLYGNASGGVIALRTEDGQGMSPMVRTRFGVGSDGFSQLGVQAGGQWDRVHGWVSVSDLDYEGQRDHSSTSKRLFNANGTFSLAPSHRLKLAVTVLDQPFGEDPGALTREQVRDDRWQASAQSESLNAGQTVRQERVGLAHEVDLANENVLSSYVFRTSRDFKQQLPSSFFPSLIAFQRAFYGAGSSLRMSQFSDWRFTAGLDWAKQVDDRQRYRVDSKAAVVAQTQNERQLAESSGLFVQAHRQLNDWAFQLGVRYDQLDLTIDEFLQPAATPTTRRFNEWNLMAGATYAFGSRLSGFLNWSEGFESPTFTEI